MNNEPTRVTKSYSTLIDLVIASRVELIKKTLPLELDISDHKLMCGCLQTKVRRPPPKLVQGRTFKRFNQIVRIYSWYEKRPIVCVFCFWWSWWQLLGMGYYIQWHLWQARTDESLSWVTPQILHLLNLPYKTLLNARKTKNDELWSQYRGLRNRVTEEVRRAKCYSDLFDQVKDCKSYWKRMKKQPVTTPRLL